MGDRVADNAKGEPGKPHLLVNAKLGLGGIADVERWNPLFVTCTNVGEYFKGTLVVRGLRVNFNNPGRYDIDPVRYRALVSVPRGETRRVEVPVHPNGWEGVEVTFSQRGYQQRYEVLLSKTDDVRCRILVVTDTGARYLKVGRWVEERFKELEEFVQGSDKTISSTEITCAIDSVRPATLPELSTSYDPFQLVILHDTQLQLLPDPVRRAFERWVERGGHVFVIPGTTWFAGVDERFGEFVGVRRGDEKVYESGDPRDLAASLELGESLLPRDGARLVHDGLAIEQRRGLGRLVTLRAVHSGTVIPSEGGETTFFGVFLLALATFFSVVSRRTLGTFLAQVFVYIATPIFMAVAGLHDEVMIAAVNPFAAFAMSLTGLDNAVEYLFAFVLAHGTAGVALWALALGSVERLHSRG